MPTKTSQGRLLEAGVIQIHVLRDAWTPERQPKKHSSWTLAAIAKEVGVTLGTVQAVCSDKTHKDLHPSRALYWELLTKYYEVA